MRKATVDWTKTILWLLNIIAQQFIAVIVLHILWNLFDREDFKINSLVTWHIIFCTIGIAVLMSEALIILSSSSILTVGVQRPLIAKVHAVVMLSALIFLTIGISLNIYHKSEHFNSTHGIVGLVAWILSFCGFILGGTIRHTLKPNFIFRPVDIKFFHNFVGTTAYILGLVALYYGLQKPLITSSENTKIGISVLILLAGLFSIYSALISMVNQFRTALNI